MTSPAPFLDIEAFKSEFGKPLGDGETVTAERLLRVASRRVRELVDDPDEDDAKQVVFEVVRDAALYGELDKLSSYQNITSRRQESGTFDPAMKVVDDYLSPKHKRLLGVATVAAPLFNFPECDY